MQQLIKHIANDRGINAADAASLFAAFTAILTTKIPQLTQVINEAFTNADADLLQDHFNKAMALFQQQQTEKYRSWLTPPSHYGNTKYAGGGELF